MCDAHERLYHILCVLPPKNMIPSVLTGSRTTAVLVFSLLNCDQKVMWWYALVKLREGYECVASFMQTFLCDFVAKP